MSKYTRAELEAKTDNMLYIIAYDDCPAAYDLLPTSRKHLINALLNCPTPMPQWVNGLALSLFLMSLILLLTGVLEPMNVWGYVIMSLIIGVATGFLINWVYETIKPPLPTQSKVGLISFMSLIVFIVALMGFLSRNPPPPPTVTPLPAVTPIQISPFPYQVHVIALKGREGLKGAEITIFAKNKPALIKVTDDAGLAIFEIDADLAGQLADLTVKLECYDLYTLNIRLSPDKLPQTIPLTSVSCENK